MISVAEALDHLFALAPRLGTEEVALTDAAGRVLARPVAARRDQPPFAASAMDGYAIATDAAQTGDSFEVVGESAAGHGHRAALGEGEAVRIFTGAPLPENAVQVLLQEDVRREGTRVTLTAPPEPASHIRPAGADFRAGTEIAPPRLLRPADIALAAAMNVARLPVARRPVVALMATGDELVAPGEEPGADQIIASNTYGLHAMLRGLGAEPRLLPIARDTEASLRAAFELAEGADLVVTVGGASVGDHDLVGKVAGDLGMERAFYRVAMRPGKPLMAGRIGGAMMIGLPGNPVSAMVCGHVFLAPVLRAMQGLPAVPAPETTLPLAADIGPNGPREHYMRAEIAAGALRPFARQDSALLGVLAAADALMIRPPHDAARRAGEEMRCILL